MAVTTPARLLRLLSLLESRSEWAGAELAERLGVTDRTVRRDIGRLRELGYPVDATTGTAGGYRLVSGRALPPLLLDDDEAVAVATGLLTAANVAEIEETALRALAKLTRVLPERLSRRVATVVDTTVAVPDRRGPRVDPVVLAALATATRDREIVTFGHHRRGGTSATRRVEPHQLLTAYGAWYLLAFDLLRNDWRIFRLDRIEDVESVRHRFAPRPLPESGAAGHLRRGLTTAPYRYTASVTVHAPADAVRARIPLLLPDRVEPLTARPGGRKAGLARGAGGAGERCLVQLGSDSLHALARDIVALDSDIELDGPPELIEHLHAVGRRLLAAGARDHDQRAGGAGIAPSRSNG
jgi:predicted DNA-binding transcriptional regulator YafY